LAEFREAILSTEVVGVTYCEFLSELTIVAQVDQVGCSPQVQALSEFRRPVTFFITSCTPQTAAE
jgi:hypothetical protein